MGWAAKGQLAGACRVPNDRQWTSLHSRIARFQSLGTLKPPIRWPTGGAIEAEASTFTPSSIIALVAAVLGFGGISGMSFEIAKFIAIIAVILFVVSLVVGSMRGRGPRI